MTSTLDTPTDMRPEGRSSSALLEPPPAPLRLGRISYLNVFPMHWALDHEPAFTGVPTAVNAKLLAGELDVACISSIEYARNADELILLPSLCVGADGAVGSIFLISGTPVTELTHVHVTPASATSAVLLRLLLQMQGVEPIFDTLDGQVADAAARPGHGVLLIGDEALRARSDADVNVVASFHDLGQMWHDTTGLPMVFAVWAVRRDALGNDPRHAVELDAAFVRALDRFTDGEAGIEAATSEYGLGHESVRGYLAGLRYPFDERAQAGLTRFYDEATRCGLLDATPTIDFVLPKGTTTMASTTTPGTGSPNVQWVTGFGDAEPVEKRQLAEDEASAAAAIELERAALEFDVDDVLDKALRDERIDEVEALSLLLSKRLIDIGNVAHELRLRRTPADQVTFIIDRNINYTNVCVTDCGFCAFYRRPGEAGGYLLDNELIYEKIQETVDLGGTAALLQGGHHPDLGIEYYTELFTGIKERFPAFHLHALSPPEIQHISRRSKMTITEVLSTLRDAGLDSLPGGGGEVLVDRVRRVMAPKKTKAGDWLGIMRQAQVLGMSTTASMMYGHVDLLADRVEHMSRVRALQDETGGFRAFISWTFQPGETPLAKLIQSGRAPYAEHLPTQPTPFEYLLTQAVSRIFLDNIDNIQSSWVTQGMKVGQAALQYGANDMGSIMIEENVVSSAGTTFSASTQDFVHAISAMGMRAVQRDTLYRTIREHQR